MNVNSSDRIERGPVFFSILVTLDMYRMLQAVEREPEESIASLEDRTTNQSPASHQKDILVSLASPTSLFSL